MGKDVTSAPHGALGACRARSRGWRVIEVPRSQGRNGAAVDDGPLFDATID